MALGCGSGELVGGLRFADESAAKLRVPEAGSPSVRFCAFGDWGHNNEIKRRMIAAMVSAGHARESDFIALLGDNFYMDGIASARDPRWESDFEVPFPKSEFPGPFHPVLGNHDYRGNPRAQVEYSRSSPRWRMPGFYYSASFEIDADNALEVFFLDTTPIDDWEDCAEGQLRWLEDKLATSNARWKIAAGHHAIFSGGTSGASSRLRRRLGPLFEQYGVSLYLAGHDHDLELLDSRAGWLEVVSGSTSRPRRVRWTPRSLFATSEVGYVRITAEPDRLWIEFVTALHGPCATYRIDARTPVLESTAPSR